MKILVSAVVLGLSCAVGSVSAHEMILTSFGITPSPVHPADRLPDNTVTNPCTTKGEKRYSMNARRTCTAVIADKSKQGGQSPGRR